MTEQELMLTAILNCERRDLYVDATELTPEQKEKLASMQQRRSQSEPLQYILGECEFMGLKFKTDRRALVPRPETELLVENVLQVISGHQRSQLRILDIGTGSGNITIALAKSLSQAKIFSLDISAEAIQLARHNSQLNHVVQQIDFAHVAMQEFFNNYTEARKRFDIIVSNPPYIKTAALASLPADVQQEPLVALDGGEDGLDFYRIIISEARHFLKDDGFLACEFGDGQKDAIEELLWANNFIQPYFVNDYTGTPRLFIARV